MAQAHIQRTNGLTASATNVIHILAGCRDGAATKFPSDTIHLVVGSPESLEGESGRNFCNPAVLVFL